MHNLKDPELLEERLRQAKEEHFGLRFQHATGSSRTPPLSAPRGATSRGC